MTAHTSGPWEVTTEHPGGLTIKTADGDWCIAGCLPGGKPTEKANARLIAAAPDLLEAAMAMVEGRPTECPVDPVMGKGGVAYANWIKLNALRAAIAKATGADQ